MPVGRPKKVISKPASKAKAKEQPLIVQTIVDNKSDVIDEIRSTDKTQIEPITNLHGDTYSMCMLLMDKINEIIEKVNSN